MRGTAVVLLSCLAVTAASAAAPPADGPVLRSTGKAADQFAACFAGAEDRAAQPWSYVPKENGGGTFSNLGARGVSSTYFLKVADLGRRREIRLEAANASAGASVLRAVDSCV
jgi:hypothetical protein